jgi:hypothetical protein
MDTGEIPRTIDSHPSVSPRRLPKSPQDYFHTWFYSDSTQIRPVEIVFSFLFLIRLKMQRRWKNDYFLIYNRLRSGRIVHYNECSAWDFYSWLLLQFLKQNKWNISLHCWDAYRDRHGLTPRNRDDVK